MGVRSDGVPAVDDIAREHARPRVCVFGVRRRTRILRDRRKLHARASVAEGAIHQRARRISRCAELQRWCERCGAELTDSGPPVARVVAVEGSFTMCLPRTSTAGESRLQRWFSSASAGPWAVAAGV